ncbi:hypothetical protein CEXT_688121 [Caerostris extrusa]|uniref:Uncharacterized protein n=1 Tax=Caerostris extrusa TaxID=172846 RepID=A0AAV4Y5J6_CAEEX|nr:hypothetical protein CEXT_688121 [Caerostris extrusa]
MLTSTHSWSTILSNADEFSCLIIILMRSHPVQEIPNAIKMADEYYLMNQGSSDSPDQRPPVKCGWEQTNHERGGRNPRELFMDALPTVQLRLDLDLWGKFYKVFLFLSEQYLLQILNEENE